MNRYTFFGVVICPFRPVVDVYECTLVDRRLDRYAVIRVAEARLPDRVFPRSARRFPGVMGVSQNECEGMCGV